MRINEVYDDGDYEGAYIRHQKDTNVYSMVESDIGAIVEEAMLADVATIDLPIKPGDPPRPGGRGIDASIMIANMMHDRKISNSLRWGAVWYDDTILPTGEFEIGERLTPLESQGGGEFAFLASAAKPSSRKTKESPMVGMKLAYDVDAALPRFHFQSYGHPLEKDIRKAEKKEFQTLCNEDVFRRLTPREKTKRDYSSRESNSGPSVC